MCIHLYINAFGCVCENAIWTRTHQYRQHRIFGIEIIIYYTIWSRIDWHTAIIRLSEIKYLLYKMFIKQTRVSPNMCFRNFNFFL